ncbi:hypothetical protein CIW49_08205 [Mycolicibacterium sp. P1-18]|nr:hypothetical protein CIW49_08205 [Mycolicibacterium sp. P1-18]
MYRIAVVVGPLLAAATAVLYAFAAVVLVVVGNEWRHATMFASWTLCAAGLAIGSGRYGSEAMTPRVDVDGHGTTFRPDRLVDVALGLAGVGSLVYFAYMLTSPSRVATGPFATPAWMDDVLTVVLTLLILGICLWLSGYVRWGASKVLRLTPRGVEMGQLGQRRHVSWGDVRSVTDKLPRARKRTPSSIVVLTSRGKTLHLTTNTFTADGATIRDLVEFYWKNPAARVELTTGGVSTDRQP